MASFADITSYSDGAYKVIIVAALLVALQILMVGGRFASRKIRKAPLAADDFMLLIAAALTIGLCAFALACKLIQKWVKGFNAPISQNANSGRPYAVPRIAGIGAPDAITQTQDLSESKILGQVSSAKPSDLGQVAEKDLRASWPGQFSTASA